LPGKRGSTPWEGTYHRRMANPLYQGPEFNIGVRTWIKRCLLCALQPLTGPRATGAIFAQAIGADVEVPKGSYAVVVQKSPGALSDQLDWQRLVKVAAKTTVTSSGTEIPVFSAWGGAYQNVPIETTVRWAPALAGLQPTAIVSTALTGGTTPNSAVALKRLAFFDKLGIARGASVSPDLVRSRVGDFPAGIIAYVGSGRGDRPGREARLRPLRFQLFVIATRMDGHQERSDDSDVIIDWAEGLLEERQTIDGESFAQPSVIITGSMPIAADDLAYLHRLDIEVPAMIEKIDPRTFPGLLELHETFSTPPSPGYPQPDDSLGLINQTQQT
jgi:hypothetical protein